MPGTQHQRVLILGAGFAGMGVAQELTRLLSPEDACEITIVDQNNFSLFTPMLTEVAGGQVDPASIVVAIRSFTPRVTVEQAQVQAIDAANKTVRISIGDEVPGLARVERTLSADHLVIALGSVTNFHGINGLEEHSLTIKSVYESEAIRDHAIALLERADEEPDRDNRRALLTFVVGGGGFSGVETMAALNDLVRELVKHCPHIEPADVRTIIAHPGPRLLPEISEGLARYAQQKLERAGVEVMLHTSVTGAGADFVKGKVSTDNSSQRINAHTLIWTGGVKPSPVIDTAGLKLGKHHGIVVDSCCRVPDHPGVWALGDCAEVPKPDGHETYAPTAQNATREGKHVARNIVAACMHGLPPQPFQYHAIGELAIVGKRSGVAKIYGRQVSGVAAWLMWRAIYLAKLPSLAKRVHVGLGWLLDAAFGLDPVAVKPQPRMVPTHDGRQAGTSPAETTSAAGEKRREEVASGA